MAGLTERALELSRKGVIIIDEIAVNERVSDEENARLPGGLLSRERHAAKSEAVDRDAVGQRTDLPNDHLLAGCEDPGNASEVPLVHGGEPLGGRQPQEPQKPFGQDQRDDERERHDAQEPPRANAVWAAHRAGPSSGRCKGHDFRNL